MTDLALFSVLCSSIRYGLPQIDRRISITFCSEHDGSFRLESQFLRPPTRGRNALTAKNVDYF